jgi:hypothetical protein
MINSDEPKTLGNEEFDFLIDRLNKIESGQLIETPFDGKTRRRRSSILLKKKIRRRKPKLESTDWIVFSNEEVNLDIDQTLLDYDNFLQIKTEEISFTNSSFHEGLIDFIENLGTNYNPIFHSRIVREIGNKQNKEIHFALIKKGGNPISIFFIVYNSKNNKEPGRISLLGYGFYHVVCIMRP